MFDYYTVQLRYGKFCVRVTTELRPEDQFTVVRWSMAIDALVPRPLRGVACRLLATRMMRIPERLRKLDQVIASHTTTEFTRSQADRASRHAEP